MGPIVRRSGQSYATGTRPLTELQLNEQACADCVGETAGSARTVVAVRLIEPAHQSLIDHVLRCFTHDRGFLDFSRLGGDCFIGGSCVDIELTLNLWKTRPI